GGRTAPDLLGRGWEPSPQTGRNRWDPDGSRCGVLRGREWGRKNGCGRGCSGLQRAHGSRRRPCARARSGRHLTARANSRALRSCGQTERERSASRMRGLSGISAFFAIVIALAVVPPGAANPPPPPWLEAEIGDPGAPGSADVDFNGIWTVKGSGVDIFGNAD